MSNDWIPIDKASINYQTRYEVTYNGGKVEVVEGHDIYRDQCTAIRPYNPTPYVPPTPIDPGEGWRLLEEGEELKHGDEYQDATGWCKSVDIGKFKNFLYVYRRRIEPTPIDPGEGWRWLEVGELKRASDEWTVGKGWQASCNEGQIVDKPFVYRRRIAPTYRPFASAAEYAPHRDRWLKHKMRPSERCKLSSYDDDSPWQLFFERYVFEDTDLPFGVEMQP